MRLSAGIYSGKPLRLIGVNIDVTERKRAQQALQQKTDLVNFSHDGVISTDENRVIMTWNAGAEEIYGWTEDEAVGKVMHQLFQTGSPVSVAEIVQHRLRVPRYNGQQVIEIVGHASREPSNSLKFLRLPELVLETFALADVTVNLENSNRNICRVTPEYLPAFDDDLLAVPPCMDEFPVPAAVPG